jgi:hypothetical protein
MQDIAFVTTSSYLPLVFSIYNRVETFATNFTIKINYANGTELITGLDSHTYGLLSGAYNRRNIYGGFFHMVCITEEISMG